MSTQLPPNISRNRLNSGWSEADLEHRRSLWRSDMGAFHAVADPETRLKFVRESAQRLKSR